MTQTLEPWQVEWRERFGNELDGSVVVTPPRPPPPRFDIMELWESGDYEKICDIPVLRGSRRGQVVKGKAIGAQRHRKIGEEPCDECRGFSNVLTMRERQIQGGYERICDVPILKGPNKGKSARGTWAGERRHRMEGESYCDDCREWMQVENRKRPRTREFRVSDLSGLPRSSRCDGCGEAFLDDESWDAHFHRSTPDGLIERCLTVEELRWEGMVQSGSWGSWTFGPKTCGKGHLMKGANIMIRLDNGGRQCRTCNTENAREWMAAKKAQHK